MGITRRFTVHLVQSKFMRGYTDSKQHWQAPRMHFHSRQHFEMDMEYLPVIIDEYSRYPEVGFVHRTSAQAVISHLDRVFSTYSFHEMAKTDGGLQFNRHDYHQIYGIGWHAQRTSEPRELGRQLTNRTLHDSHEQSLSHRPYRREEPQTRALQIPQTLLRHATQLHVENTCRSPIKSLISSAISQKN